MQDAVKETNALTHETWRLWWEVNELEGAVSGYLEEQREANEVQAKASQRAAAQAEAYAVMESRVNSLIDEMENLQQAYDDSYQSAYNNITKTIGLFNTLSTETDKCISDFIAALDSQIEFMDTYAENIVKAMELGVDKGLVEKLSDGSEESSKILQAIVDDGGENIDALNERLAGVEEGKQRFGHSVAEMETDYNNKMTSIVERTNAMLNELDNADEFTRVARNNMLGLIDGVKSMERDLVEAYRSIARNALAAYKAEMDQKSPSRKMYAAGVNDVTGLIQGAESMRLELMGKYAHLGDSALRARNSVAALPVGIGTRLTGMPGGNAPGGVNMHIEQNIYANELSYAEMQREAAQEIRQVARGLVS